jgi:hypothetical protein
MKAQRKPNIVDYFDPTINIETNNFNTLVEWVNSFDQVFQDWFFLNPELKVKTLEGTSYNITTDDVIIRGPIKGEYYPCKKDIFEATYDKIDE